MAKYTVLMGCGHEDTLELLGKHEDRRRKIKYFEENGLCKECYKKKMEQADKEKGLVFNASVLPDIDEKDGEILLSVWFSGDTMTHKDEIKQLGGYFWDERQAADDFYALRVPKCWNKTIKWRQLEGELEKAVRIGAKHAVSDKGLFAMVHYQIALKKQNKWKIQNAKISELQKPAVPDILKGHSWNRKVYGKAGSFSIYPDGEKVSISDTQAEEIMAYVAARDEYNKKVEEIKNEKKP